MESLIARLTWCSLPAVVHLTSQRNCLEHTMNSVSARFLRCVAGGGSATLESLMERLTWRGRPAVVDLTTERKLADKVRRVGSSSASAISTAKVPQLPSSIAR